MEQSTRSPTIHKEITTMEFCDQLLCSNSHKVRIKHTHTNNNVLVSRLKWSVMYWIKIHWELTDVLGSLAQGRDASVWASLCLASQQNSTLSSDKNIIIYSNELLEVVPEESSVYWPRYNHVMVTIASERYLTIYQDRLPWRLDMLHTPYQYAVVVEKSMNSDWAHSRKKWTTWRPAKLESCFDGRVWYDESGARLLLCWTIQQLTRRKCGRSQSMTGDETCALRLAELAALL